MMEELNEVATDTNFNVYVGSETGVLKGIYFGQEVPRLKNFHTFDELSESKSIASLSWVDETKKEILVAFKSQLIKIYNTKLRSFTTAIKVAGTDSTADVVGIYSYKSSHVIGVQSGEVTLWNFAEDKNLLKLSTGKDLATIQQCWHSPNIVATGGKENDLKVWNLDSPEPALPIFSAKNVPHDSLDLRVPVWVQGLTFLPQSSELVAVCTRYGQVRLYDPKVNNKARPVINMQFMDHPLMAISTTQNNRQVLVGSSQGKMGLLDLRNGNQGNVVHHFGGFSGSIRSISAHPEAPYFVSCGLDRHLYLHHLNTKKPLKKLYLKSRLNCALITDHFNTDFEFTGDEALLEKVHWQNIHMEPLQPYVGPTPSDILPPEISPKKRKVQRRNSWVMSLHGFLDFFQKEKTFRPRKKFEPGTLRYGLHKAAQASLNSGINLKEAVKLPSNEDSNDWIAVHVVDFFNRINLIYGTVCDYCSEKSCPKMSGGPKFEYLWADGCEYKKPAQLPAPKYVSLLMDWIESQINNEKTFPTSLDTAFPKNFVNICRKILTRLFRVFVHVYIHHFDRVVALGAEAHVNTCYKHFYYFVTEFNLISPKELEPLKDMTEKICPA